MHSKVVSSDAQGGISGRRRIYQSALRAQSAQSTRRQVLAAARELFVARGFAATTIDDIARAAGVSRPTVFASAGNKSEILKVLRDLALAGDEEPLPVLQRAWYQEALVEPDPVRSIQLHARNMARIYERYADLDMVIHQAAGVDPSLAEFARTSESQRRAGAAAFIEALAAKTPLRAGLDENRATEALWALAASDGYRRLVNDCAWTSDDYQDWLARMLVCYLLPSRPTTESDS